MDDMAAKISEVLNDSESMAQIMQIAQSLGLSGNQGGQTPNQSPPSNTNFNTNNSNSNTQQQTNQNAPNNQNTQHNDNNQGNQGNQDISSTLAGIMNSLGGGNSGNPSQNETPQFDVGTMIKIQKAMSAFTTSNKNVELLRTLKPHFGEERQKKVDDAIKVMQLINMLPLLKESGLFGMLGNDKS